MRYGVIAVLIMMLAIGSLVAAPMLQAAEDVEVTITVIGADGEPLKNVKVTLYDTSGDEYSNTTNETGVTKISVPANDTFLVVVKTEYYILDTFNTNGVTDNMTYEVNASAMYYANITADPISVDVVVNLTAFEYKNITVTTNVKVYAPSELNISFPKEIEQFPWRYVLQNITYDNSVESEKSYVTLDMVENYDVKATYEKQFYYMLETWQLALLVGIVILAIVIAIVATPRAARAVIEEWREKNSKFVRRK